MELFSVDEEDLGLLLVPRYHDYDLPSGERYDEEERYWSMDLHARDTTYLDDPDVNINFDAEVAFDNMDWETLRDVEYPYWIQRFENEFEDAETLLYTDLNKI